MTKPNAWHDDTEFKSRVIEWIDDLRPTANAVLPRMALQVDRQSYIVDLGIPNAIGHLAQRMAGYWNEIDGQLASAFTLRFFEAIPVGSDASIVADRFTLRVLEETARLANNAEKTAYMRRLLSLYGRTAEGESVSLDEWRDLRADLPGVDIEPTKIDHIIAAASKRTPPFDELCASDVFFEFRHAFADAEFMTRWSEVLFELLTETKPAEAVESTVVSFPEQTPIVSPPTQFSVS